MDTDCCRACQSRSRGQPDDLGARVPIRASRPEKLAIRVRIDEGDVVDHAVTKDVIVIGRNPERADIVLRDRVISRIQCRFIFRNGEVEVEDLGSACGTMVLGLQIKRTTLRWGDVVRVGNSELEIVRS